MTVKAQLSSKLAEIGEVLAPKLKKIYNRTIIVYFILKIYSTRLQFITLLKKKKKNQTMKCQSRARLQQILEVKEKKFNFLQK